MFEGLFGGGSAVQAPSTNTGPFSGLFAPQIARQRAANIGMSAERTALQQQQAAKGIKNPSALVNLQAQLHQKQITPQQFTQQFAKASRGATGAKGQNAPTPAPFKITPGQILGSAGTAAKTVLGGIAQSTARIAPEIAATAQQSITHKPVTYSNKNGVSQFLFGKAPIQSIQQEGAGAKASHPGGFHIPGTPVTLTPTETGTVERGIHIAQDVPLVGGLAKVATKVAEEGAAQTFRGGAEALLSKIKPKAPEAPAPTAMTDVMTPEQADKAAAAAHTQIKVNDSSSPGEKVGVTTPVRPGIKQVSETSNINVRTPAQMSDQQFTTEFNKLSKSYEADTNNLRAQAKLGSRPEIVQAMQDKLEAYHQAKLNDLIDRYHNPELTPQKAPKTVAKSTLPAEKTTGGTPSEKTINSAPKTAAPDTGVTTTPSESTPKLTGSKPAPTSGLKMLKTGGLKTAPSQLSVKVSAKAVEGKMTEDLASAPKEHGVMNIKEQAGKATDLINTDEQKATDIALGKRNAPSGLHPHAVFVAVEKKATQEGNIELLRQLAQSKRVDESTAAGQTLRVLRERDDHSPVSAIQHVIDARKAAVEKRTGQSVAKAITSTAKEIDSNIKPVSIKTWSDFVESIKC